MASLFAEGKNQKCYFGWVVAWKFDDEPKKITKAFC